MVKLESDSGKFVFSKVLPGKYTLEVSNHLYVLLISFQTEFITTKIMEIISV